MGKSCSYSSKKKREDLARAALMRKQKYQERTNELGAKLQKLATLTETLLRSQDLIGEY